MFVHCLLLTVHRSVFISDILATENIDIFAFSETFQNPNITPAQLFDITPHNFQFLGQPRQDSAIICTLQRQTLAVALVFLSRICYALM
jgi:hypothetical protein